MKSLTETNVLFLTGKHKEALDAYLCLARDEHDETAAMNAGYMFHRGIGAMRDYRKAMECYVAASMAEGGAACYNMAIMYLRGQGVPVDFAKAIELMQRAAQLGSNDAKLYLGMAYILGCAYDPVEIECLSLIPFCRVIYRDLSVPLLAGEGFDPDLEDKRYEVIEADGEEAVAVYESIRPSDDSPRAAGIRLLMLGKAAIEGLGGEFNPAAGYRKLYSAAVNYQSAEAAQYLLANADIAKTYRIDLDRLELLSSHGYFRPITGNLGTPRSHRVPLLIPDESNPISI
jgi:TPR repeat protein